MPFPESVRSIRRPVRNRDAVRSDAEIDHRVGDLAEAGDVRAHDVVVRLAEFGGGKLILGADIRDGAVAVQGWTERSEMTAQELIARFAPQGLAQVICTDIARDGMLCGTSAEFYAGLQGQFPGVEITVSGGIASMTDIEALDGAGLRSVIVGKALYEGRITLEELKRCLPNA